MVSSNRLFLYYLVFLMTKKSEVYLEVAKLSGIFQRKNQVFFDQPSTGSNVCVSVGLTKSTKSLRRRKLSRKLFGAFGRKSQSTLKKKLDRAKNSCKRLRHIEFIFRQSE